MTMIDTDILIVGAGPTGLALAIQLQRAGIDHLLIDALPEGANTSRAGVVHAHTLEMMEPLGVVGRMLDEGLKLTKFTARDRESALLNIRFDALPSRHRHILMIPQYRTEAILGDRLAALGGRIHRLHTLLSLRQERGGAVARVATPAGEMLVRAKYVVGADGMRSMVRQSTGIRFAGGTYGESFALADVHLDWPLGRDEVSLLFSPAGLVVVAPLPDGTMRIVATMDNPPETPTIADIQAILDERGPRGGGAKVRDVVWSTRFRVHHRLASDYREGCVLLMGDAAHVHSPAGGQGMNTGLIDAMALGDALIRTMKGSAGIDWLQRYAQTRRPAAAKVIGLASRLTRMATVRSVTLRRLRNLLLRVLDKIGPFKSNLSLQLSGIGRARYSVLDKAEPGVPIATVREEYAYE